MAKTKHTADAKQAHQQQQQQQGPGGASSQAKPTTPTSKPKPKSKPKPNPNPKPKPKPKPKPNPNPNPNPISSQASDGPLPGSEQKVGKKSDKEIYLETCATHPTTVGCPTCEEVPTMPHCGLNQSAWQDLSGFPKGADPKSCASIGDVTKEWCVMLGLG